MTGSSLPEHETFFFYLQRICNHCTYPGCLAACPRKAIYKRPEDGIVLIDQNRCRGYKKCVEQCPYKKPMYRGTTRVSEKCIACYPRVEGKDPLTGGEPMETRCMAACVGKIRLQGDRKSTRLNSSHLVISYAVFCLKKKNSTLTSGWRYEAQGTSSYKSTAYCRE